MPSGGVGTLIQGDEALASGQHAGFGALLVEEGNRFIQRFRGKILEAGWYHKTIPFRMDVDHVTLAVVIVNAIYYLPQGYRI